MRFLQCFLVVLIMCLFMNVYAVSADVIGVTDKSVQAIAEPALDGILEGFKTGDYPTYSKDFDKTLKDAISKEEFTKVRTKVNDTYGFCEGKEYLGFLTKGKTTVALWKGRFDKGTDDVLIKLTMIKREDKYLVTNLRFQ